jgi:transketolase
MAMRDVLLERIWQAMADDPRIYFASADFGAPTLDKIRADFPTRFVNVGIAEQNLINISAGLALEGYTVFAYAIAPFITMRCYEQVRVNLALLSEVRPMNVNLIGVGAGYSYVVSGPTHQCYEDLTLMRALPNVKVYSPADHLTAGALFDRCAGKAGIKYLRFDAQILPPVYKEAPAMEQGFECHRRGGPLALVATGYMLHTALAVAEALAVDGIAVGVYDLFDLADFDRVALIEALQDYQSVFSLEEGFHGRGGLDALLGEMLRQADYQGQFKGIGVEPGYRFELGSREVLHEQVGIGRQAVEQTVRSALSGPFVGA